MTTTTVTKTQIRGICQCCGREQAVMASGLMSKHGYTVEHGWFSGVCYGQRHRPMQIDRSVADDTIRTVRADCVELDETAAALKAGRVTPATCKTPHYNAAKRDFDRVAWADATPYQQEQAVAAAISRAESRARTGRAFADQLQALADRYHGQPLLTVAVEAGPAPIGSDERRVLPRGIAAVRYVERGMVHWRDERGFSGRMSTRSWRALPIAPALADAT
jgi:hypothetical protein